MNRPIFQTLFALLQSRPASALLVFAAAFVLSFLCVQLPMRKFRRSSRDHWTQQARYFYQVTRVMRFQHAFYAVVALFIALCGELLGVRVEHASSYLVLPACALAGTYLTHYLVIRRAFPELASPLAWARNLALRYLPIFFQLALFAGMTWALAEVLHWPPVFCAVIAWLFVYAAMLAGGWIAPYRLFGYLMAVPPRLHIIIEETTKQMGVPYPRQVLLLKSGMPYAAAMPTASMLIFSRGILEILDDDELLSVTAHEMAHLEESAAQVTLRCLPAALTVPAVCLAAWLLKSNPLTLLATSAGCVVVLGALASLVSRSLELRADRGAKTHQTAAGVYARALEKVYARRLIPAVLPRRLQTHPDLYDRMLSAGVTPSYPRPLRPPTTELRVAVLASSLVLTGLIALLILGSPRGSIGAVSAPLQMLSSWSRQDIPLAKARTPDDAPKDKARPRRDTE